MSAERHARIVELLTRASDLAPEERAAFLARACVDDPSLRTEVEGLLASGEGATVFAEGALESRETPTSARVLEQLQARIGKESRYQILGEFARGGMGAILRVWDRDLRRTLAMKVVLGQSEEANRGDTPAVDEKTLGRFLEEAQVTGQLDHPGIVPVHELGLDADRQVYFTMRLVKGDDLKAVFELLRSGEGGWTQTRVLGVIQRVCEAMAYAHSKKVIHRDLKPSNIMVGRFGEVYVMDWGLAHVTGQEDKKDIRVRPPEGASLSRVRTDRREEASADSPLLTMDGDVVGTPAYMSPEQARGEIAAMGPASDVYSIGAILYELLAGHMPYVPPGTKVNPYAIWALAQQHAPTPVAQLAPKAPEELVAICEKAMGRAPAERYANMGELAEELQAYLEGRVVKAHRTGAVVELKKWVQRNKALGTALAAAVVLAVGGAGAVGYVEAEGRRAAEVQFLRAEAERERAETAEALARARQENERRLSDGKRGQELAAEADLLWPAYPDRIPELEHWLERARDLLANLSGYRATLEEMPDSGLTAEEQWQQDVLAQLIGELEELEWQVSAEPLSMDRGWSVATRLEFARELEAGFATGGTYSASWSDALPEIADAYPGLDLKPQLGLLPLGPDPASGLWEFAHLMSGEPPHRDAEGRLVVDQETGVVLVLLEGGVFWMGGQADDPAGQNYDPISIMERTGKPHEVELSPFFLSKYELTQGQWLRLMGNNPAYHQFVLPPEMTPERLEFYAETTGTDLPNSQLYPVENVSWDESVEVCRRLGLALPTEAQWEYGARGGATTPWWTGAERASLVDPCAANLADQTAMRVGAPYGEIARGWPEFDDGFMLHAPVNRLAANAFGLHHVLGNVWEMCRDGAPHDSFYDPTQTLDPFVDPADHDYRANRGGSFRVSERFATLAVRDVVGGDSSDLSTGFRPSREIDR